MTEFKTYKYDNFFIEKNEHDFILKTASNNYDSDKKKLFTAMLNFGHVNFENGIFQITDRDIVNFWNDAKTLILKNYSLEKYCEVLDLPKPYTEKIPSIQIKGAFYAQDFKMTVAWQNAAKQIKAAPLAYKRRGLVLYDMHDDELGSLYPEYFELYLMIDNANTEWKNFNNTQKKDFVDQLKKQNEKRAIIIPNNILLIGTVSPP